MSKLNPSQEKAVQHIEGPLLVLAGAGSGKTRVVTHRIAHLLESGVSPSEMLAVTFTNRAAAEMKERIRALKDTHVLACTFHSLGARILRESIHHLGYDSNFVIYDTDDSEKLLKACLKELDLPDTKGAVKEIKYSISNAKNDLLTSDQIDSDVSLRLPFTTYQRKLKECNALDFDDLLYLTVKLLQQYETVKGIYQNRWRFLLIDEYQDTNLAQYTLTKLLVEKHQNIFAVGDPDQSIYSWRGARYQNILNFEMDFEGATIVTLDQNYRSTNKILQAANALIENNEKRIEKELWSDLGDGEDIGVYLGYNERDEAQFVASRIVRQTTYDDISPDEIAIFYRTNAQSRTFEDALLAKRIPYTIIGGLSFYERKEIKDIIAFLRLIISNSDLIAFLRTVNIPKRGLGAKSLEKIVSFANQSGIPILIYCENLVDDSAELKLPPKQKEGLRSYLRILHRLRDQKTRLSIADLIKELLYETGYLAYLQEDPDSAQDRKENIDELLGKAMEWEGEHENPTLDQFLEELSLHIPKQENGFVPTVKMMTLHNSKGLEFPTVFLVGMEEDLLPHINSKDDYAAIEEERRLCYVGMTRAKKKLYLTAASSRYMWGTERYMKPSRFLEEIPEEYTVQLSSKALKPRRTFPTEMNFFQ